MDQDLGPSIGHDRWVTGDLRLHFRDVLPDSAIEATIADAARELRGQVPPEAFDGLLHRLVAYRLSEQVVALGRRMDR